jgi:hypothetical protein
LFWISLWLKTCIYNTLASKICEKLLKPPKFRFQRPTLPFGFANTFICTPRLPIPSNCHE